MSDRYEFYDALIEGRWRPDIQVEKLDKGEFRASWTDADGVKFEATNGYQDMAIGDLVEQLKIGILDGKVTPNR